MTLSTQIDVLIEELNTFNIIPERLKKLEELSKIILSQKDKSEQVNLNFICIHNSRRSHIAEFTMRLACDYYGIDFIKTFSGGTEATALNHRVAISLEGLGFEVNIKEEGDNPVYNISYNEDSREETPMFSKVFDDDFNPKQDMIAVMVCSEAEENCPYVPNAEYRYVLSYEDPKFSDDTPQEVQVYQDKVKEVGTEMFYLAKLLA